MAKSDPGNPIQVQNYLGGIDYPVGKQQLLDTARDQGAPDEVIASLERLPERQYDQPTDITREMGSKR